MIKKIREREVSGIVTFDLGICRQPHECGLFLDDAFIQTLRDKFSANGYVPKETLYNENDLDIAIHIRRGDVWDALQTGTEKKVYTNRWVSDEYYVALLQRLHKMFQSSSKPVRFHIFSDGQPEDFTHFTFINERKAYLSLAENRHIENIQFHLQQSTFDTLYHLIKTPILVPGKSSFSVVAILLGESHVLYEDEILELYQYLLLEKYMQDNPRFISLNELEEQGWDIADTLGVKFGSRTSKR